MADGESCSVGKSLDIIVPLGSPVFVDSLPERTGPRPKTNPCLPHQQRSDNPSKDVWEKMCKRVIAGCAELFPGTTGPHRSLVSLPDSLALFLDGDASIPCARPFIGKEFAHVHGVSDGSLHVGLSEADAQTVIKAGWGERHLLAGKQAGKMNVPAGLVMVYGPRNEQEIETVVDILRASYKWARGDIPPLRNSA